MSSCFGFKAEKSLISNPWMLDGALQVYRWALARPLKTISKNIIRILSVHFSSAVISLSRRKWKNFKGPVARQWKEAFKKLCFLAGSWSRGDLFWKWTLFSNQLDDPWPLFLFFFFFLLVIDPWKTVGLSCGTHFVFHCFHFFRRFLFLSQNAFFSCSSKYNLS